MLIGFVSGLYTALFGLYTANMFAWVGRLFDQSSSMLTFQKEYHWEELWRAMIGLLEFLAVRVDDIKNLGRVDELVQEVGVYWYEGISNSLPQIVSNYSGVCAPRIRASTTKCDSGPSVCGALCCH